MKALYSLRVSHKNSLQINVIDIDISIVTYVRYGLGCRTVKASGVIGNSCFSNLFTCYHARFDQYPFIRGTSGGIHIQARAPLKERPMHDQLHKFKIIIDLSNRNFVADQLEYNEADTNAVLQLAFGDEVLVLVGITAIYKSIPNRDVNSLLKSSKEITYSEV